MRYFLSFLAFLSFFNASSCGNEYGHDLNGERVYTAFFYLSEQYTTFDKQEIRKDLSRALSKRGQSEDDFQNESNIALYYMKLGEVRKAINILKPLAIEYPQEYTIIANLGTAYELNGELGNALRYIKKGYELNPDSHLGSEWIHIKILEAKIKQSSNSDWLNTHPIITVNELKEKQTEYRSRLNVSRYDRQVDNHLVFQIRTRVPFTPAPNKVIANLLKTLANFYEENGSAENALMAHIYRLDFETSQSKRYTIENDLKKLMSKIRSSETGNLSPGFMHLVAIGEVDPELLIHAIDTVEFQLNKADLARISQLDSIEIMRSQVDSLNQELKSKKKRIKIQPAGENGFFWGMLFGTFGLIAGIIIATLSKRRKK